MKPGNLFSNFLSIFSYLVNRSSLIIFITIFSKILQAQGWQWQNPLPQGNTLSAIMYVNQNTIWASVWGGGSLVKSTDGGESWKVVMLPKRIYAMDVFFINENVGWTCGQLSDNNIETRNLVLGTKDGGNNWEVQLDIASFNLVTIVFANEREGWVAGEAARIYHTTDGGANWNLQVNLPGDVHSLFLLDSLHIWAANTSASGGAIYYTNNGGNTWLSDSSIDWSYDIQFIDTLNGWVAGRDKIARTTDGGETWEIQLYLIAHEWTDIFMFNENYGWAVSYSRIVITTNGGTNWITQDNPVDYGLRSISFKDSLNGFVVGSFGAIIKTVDGGLNWEDVTQRITSSWLSDIYFINDSVGWIVGEDGIILNTENGGNLWKKQNSGISTGLSDIYFIDATSGWAVGNQGKILKTTNGGNNWILETSPTSLPLQEIDFTHYPIGWIVGGSISSQGAIYKTTNAGTDWALIPSLSLPPGHYELQFPSINVGWIMVGNATVGGQQRLYKTTDGGSSWEMVLSNYSDTTYLSMYFISDETGWISTFPSYTLFHTTDGGISWQRHLTPDRFNSIFFIDSLMGWGGTFLGGIYFTTDAGRSWNSQFCPYSGSVRDIFFINNKNGWIIGGLGEILSTTSGGLTFIESNLLPNVPDKFILCQNFPNPFNSETTISIKLTKIPNSATAYVFDILGRKIRTLNIPSLSIGENLIYWDGKGQLGNTVPSGIYVYTVLVDGSLISKKMVLLR